MTDIAKSLIEKGALVNSQDLMGKLPISLAIENQLVSLFELIVAKYSSDQLKILIQDLGVELFSLSCERSLFPIVVRLINLGVGLENVSFVNLQRLVLYLEQQESKDLLEKVCMCLSNKKEFQNIIDPHKDIFFLACENGLMSIVKNYVETKGYKVNVQDPDGRTPLSIAFQFRHEELAKYLLQKGAEWSNDSKKSPIRIAMKLRLFSFISDTLLKDPAKGIGIKDYKKLIDMAARYGQTKLLRLLILRYFQEKNLAKLTYDYETNEGFLFLIHATSLLYNTSKGNAIFDGVLEKACKYGHFETATLLYKMFPSSVEHNNFLPMVLQMACEAGNVRIVDYFFSQGIGNATDCDAEGNTCLHIACKYSRNVSLVKYLLNLNFDPNARNKEGNTALHIVAKGGLNDLAELLLQKNADIYLQNEKGETALHVACDNKHALLAWKLIGFSINNLKLSKDALDDLKIKIDQKQARLGFLRAQSKKIAVNEETRELDILEKEILSHSQEKNNLELIVKNVNADQNWKSLLNKPNKLNKLPNLLPLFDNEFVSDRVFVVGDETEQIKIHINSYILSARSVHFAKLFNLDKEVLSYKEATQKEIKISNEPDPLLYKGCIEFFYANQININGENWQSALYKSEFFKEDKSLAKSIQDWVTNNIIDISKEISTENYLDLIETLTCIHIPSLTLQLAEFFKANISKIEITNNNYLILAKFLLLLKQADSKKIKDDSLKLSFRIGYAILIRKLL